MNTIIQNLNTIILAKSQLNSILQEQGVDGGDVFSTYPTKFEYIFDSMNEVIDNILGNTE